MRLQLLLSLIVAGVVFTAHNAWAGTIASLVRASGAGAEKAAGFVAHQVRYSLQEDGRYDVADVSGTLAASETQQATAALAEADELYARGQAAFDNLELENAAESVRGAVQRYERNAAYVTDVRRFAGVLFFLGVINMVRGDERAGAERIGQCYSIFPTYQPDPKLLNPGLQQSVNKISAQVAARKRASLSVTSTPGYAEVYVDGVFRGVTPLGVSDLAEGRHVLRVVKDGYRAFGTMVNVTAGKDSTENAPLRPASGFDQLEKLSTAAFEAIRTAQDDEDSLGPVFLDLGALLAVDELFLTDVKLDGDRVKIVATQYNVEKSRRLKTASHTFPYDTKPETFEREIQKLLRSQFGETTLQKSVKEVESAQKLVAEAGSGECFGMPCQRFRSRALTVGLALGGALAVTGGVFDYMAWQANKDYRKTFQSDSKSAELRDSGKSKARLGDILVGTGIVAAGVGLGFYLFTQPSGYISHDSASGDGLSFTATPTSGQVIWSTAW